MKQNPRVVLALAAVLFTLLGALGLGIAHAVTSGTPDVRVAVQSRSDGRVEVALQQRLDDGEWGERILPPSRFLAADAAQDRWHYSSPVALEITGIATGDRACFVTHGASSDIYWRTLHDAAEAKAAELGLELSVISDPDSEVQATFIRQCTAFGVTAIITTLADPATLAPALAEAQQAGVVVLSLNSGAAVAASLGSIIHIALNDSVAGEATAEAFNAAGVNGLVLCVIHEEQNVGLEQRCDGLEAALAGPIERLRIHETGTTDLEATEAAVAARLAGADDIAGVVTLNESIGLAALAAIEAGDDDAVIATFGLNREILGAVADGRILFSVYDQTIGALEYMLVIVRNLPFSAELFPGSPVFLFPPRIFGMQDAQVILAQIEAEEAAATESDG